MKNKIKIVSVLLFSVFLIPHMVFASWWNPFTWKFSKPKTETAPTVQPTANLEVKTVTPNNASVTQIKNLIDNIAKKDRAIVNDTIAKNKLDCENKKKGVLSLLNSYIQTDTNQINDFNSQIQTLKNNIDQEKNKYNTAVSDFKSKYINLEQQYADQMSADYSNNSGQSIDTQKIQDLNNQISSLTTQYKSIMAKNSGSVVNANDVRNANLLLTQIQGLESQLTTYQNSVTTQSDYNTNVLKQKWDTKLQALHNQKDIDGTSVESMRTAGNAKINDYVLQINLLQSKVNSVQKDIDDSKDKITKTNNTCSN